MTTNRRRIRVLYLVPDLGVGGAERHVTTLMPALDSALFEPSVICIGVEGALFGSLADAGVPAIALHRRKRAALPALGDLVREMRRTEPDIVIVRGYNAELLGRVAARIAGVRHVVVWVHNCGDTQARGSVRRIADRLLDRVTSAYFGVAQAQLPYMVDDLAIAPEKITIVYNGVDPHDFRTANDRGAVASLGITDDDLVVGILAAMRPEKDHALLVRAFATVVERIPQAKLLIVGDGPTRTEIEQLAGQLRIADRVVFAGARADVPDILPAIDVVVLSSYSVECFPMALLEAMAAGRPAVCTAVGGVPEMIVDGVTGYLVPAEEVSPLAQRLVELLGDEAMRRRMSVAARARVETEFGLDRSVRSTERALREIVGEMATLPTPSRPIELAVVLDLTFIGGVETLLLELFRQFDPERVRPRLICLREAGPLAKDFRSAGFEVEVLERSGRYDVSTLPKLVRSLRLNRTDAVLVPHHHRAALLLGRVAAKLAKVPANIVAAHDMDLASVGKRVFPRWAVDTMSVSDALVLLTPAQGEYLHTQEGLGRRSWQAVREVVIPNGIRLSPAPGATDRIRARALLDVPQDAFVVGIVARLSSQKAHEVLLHAVAQLHDSVPDVHLVVIGTGERELELRSLASELGIDRLTHFLGVRRDIPDVLPGLDVSCLSSVHEGVPIVLIESMSAAVPIVATDCGSVRDMVTDGENGYVVDVGDSAGMARRLVELARDPELRVQLGKRGRARAESEYRISQTARGYERLLTELVNK